MKLKRTLGLAALLTGILLTAQSFYHGVWWQGAGSTRAAFTYEPRRVAMCGGAFIDPDPIDNIPALTGWGNYHFKISTKSDSAQYFFDQGLSLYYAFHSIEAYASFLKAGRLDSTCAMAFYGKALSMGPTINYSNDFKPRAPSVQAATLSQALARSSTPLEMALIGAIQARYSNDTTLTVYQLREKYAAAMAKVYDRFPDNPDVITLYADALLLLHPWDLYTHDFKPKPWTPQIQHLLEKAIAISPKHPGANHYYIHTIEASGHPEIALKSAGLLDTLMPSVSHITHMPSHIYIRTGNYQQGILDNDAAVAGYHREVKIFAPAAYEQFLYEGHNIHLKVNCAQMGGDYTDALSASITVQALVPKEYIGIKGAGGNYYQYLYLQPTFTAVRFGKWDDILHEKLLDTLPYAALLQRFARGLAYCGKAQPAMAKKELQKMDGLIKDPVLKAPVDNYSTPFEAAGVARLILKGMIAATDRQYPSAIAELEKAVAAEDQLIYNEPRDWPLPARHYLGTILLKAGKYRQAVEVFNKDLFVNPNNGWAMTGLQLAYRQTHNAAELQRLQPRLASAWKIRDVKIEGPVFN